MKIFMFSVMVLLFPARSVMASQPNLAIQGATASNVNLCRHIYLNTSKVIESNQAVLETLWKLYVDKQVVASEIATRKNVLPETNEKLRSLNSLYNKKISEAQFHIPNFESVWKEFVKQKRDSSLVSNDANDATTDSNYRRKQLLQQEEDRRRLDFIVHKESLIEALIKLVLSENDINPLILLTDFSDAEKVILQNEIQQWGESSDVSKRRIADLVQEKWFEKLRTNPLEIEDIKKIYKLVDINTIEYTTDHPTGYSTLHFATLINNEEIFTLFLKHPRLTADTINAKDRFGYTPLHFTAARGNLAYLNLLLHDARLSADSINEMSIHGYTPLHFAVKSGNIEIIKLILQDPRLATNAINETSSGGNTPLHLAVEIGKLEIVKIILQDPRLSIDTINSLNDEGHTVLDLAKKINSPEIIALLKAHGAK